MAPTSFSGGTTLSALLFEALVAVGMKAVADAARHRTTRTRMCIIVKKKVMGEQQKKILWIGGIQVTNEGAVEIYVELSEGFLRPRSDTKYVCLRALPLKTMFIRDAP